MNDKRRVWLYGKHSVAAALGNGARQCFKLLATRNCINDLGAALHNFKPEVVQDDKISVLLPKDAVHQGIAGEFSALPEVDLSEVITGKLSVLLLDQITDPHNVGAIFRSASAFGIAAIITTERNSPPESGSLAKSASGALEYVPWVKVGNLAEAIKDLKAAGYWVVGLDGEARDSVTSIGKYAPAALVLGAEGKGMRRLTAELCDVTVKIPMDERQESLNVSNAAAIALWELGRDQNAP